MPGASLKEITFKNEICFSACYQMRASDVTNQFATILARALWIDEDSILFVALRSLIRAWREWRYEIDPRQPTPHPAVGGSTEEAVSTRAFGLSLSAREREPPKVPAMDFYPDRVDEIK